MRTTITLDPDVEKLIRREESAGRVFKEVINSAIRRGLTLPPTQQEPYQPQFPEVELRFHTGVSLVNANTLGNALSDALEDEALLAKFALAR